jgi:GR25 family glycosyltransferase involved in LPS biosynthesis
MDDFIHRIYCINLDRRKDRWNTICLPQFIKLNLQVERVSAVDGVLIDLPCDCSPQLRGRIGCAMSHLKVLRLAQQDHLERILILEDDVSFADDFIPMSSRLITHVPADWDMIFLGANHMIKPTHIGNGITKFNKAFTTHAYIVNSRMIDKLIQLINRSINEWTQSCENTPRTALDVIYADLMSTHKVYGFHKTLVTQTPSISDIEGRYVNYKSIV